MKKKQNFRKIFSVLLCILLFISNFTSVSAQDNVDFPLVIKFENFKFETRDYNPENVIVEYYKTNTKELATIKDKVTKKF